MFTIKQKQQLNKRKVGAGALESAYELREERKWSYEVNFLSLSIKYHN